MSARSSFRQKGDDANQVQRIQQLVRQLEGAARYLNAFQGEVIRLFNEPGDLAGEKVAMRQIESAIVSQTAAYRGNSALEILVPPTGIEPVSSA